MLTVDATKNRSNRARYISSSNFAFITNKDLLSANSIRERQIISILSKKKGVSIIYVGSGEINSRKWHDTFKPLTTKLIQIPFTNLNQIQSLLNENHYSAIYINDEALFECCNFTPDKTPILIDIQTQEFIFNNAKTDQWHRFLNKCPALIFENQALYNNVKGSHTNAIATFFSPSPVIENDTGNKIASNTTNNTINGANITFIGSNNDINVSQLAALKDNVFLNIGDNVPLRICGGISKNQNLKSIYNKALYIENTNIVLSDIHVLFLFYNDIHQLLPAVFKAIELQIPVVVYSAGQKTTGLENLPAFITKNTEELFFTLDTLINYNSTDNNASNNVCSKNKLDIIKEGIKYYYFNRDLSLALNELARISGNSLILDKSSVSIQIFNPPNIGRCKSELEVPVEIYFTSYFPQSPKVKISYSWGIISDNTNDKKGENELAEADPLVIYPQNNQLSFKHFFTIKTPSEPGIQTLTILASINDGDETVQFTPLSIHPVKLLSARGKNKSTILFYSDNLRATTSYLIAQQVSDLGHNVIFCTTSTSNIDLTYQHCDNQPSVVLSNDSSIKSYTDIDLFVTDDSKAKLCPTNAKCIVMPHSLIEFPDLDFFSSGYYWQHIFLNSDYILMANNMRNNFKDILKLIDHTFPQELTSYREKKLHIIPAGYPKIEYLRNTIMKRKVARHSLLYAPSTRSLSNTSIEKTRNICITLLQSFPDREIIYRPYPSLTERNSVEQLVSELRQYKNFTFDINFSAIDSQARSELIITDASSLALSFSFASLSPHIRIMDTPNTMETTSVYEGSAWYEISDPEKLPGLIKLALSKKTYWKEKIGRTQYDFTYNPGNSIEYISKQIDKISSDLSGSDWLSLDRSYPGLPINSEENFITHIKQRPHMWKVPYVKDITVSYLKYKFPNSEELVEKIDSILKGKVPTLFSTNSKPESKAENTAQTP